MKSMRSLSHIRLRGFLMPTKKLPFRRQEGPLRDPRAPGSGRCWPDLARRGDLSRRPGRVERWTKHTPGRTIDK